MLGVGRILREREIVDMGQIMEILMITYPISVYDEGGRASQLLKILLRVNYLGRDSKRKILSCHPTTDLSASTWANVVFVA